jgi:hypothetical protein
MGTRYLGFGRSLLRILLIPTREEYLTGFKTNGMSQDLSDPRLVTTYNKLKQCFISIAMDLFLCLNDYRAQGLWSITPVILM